MIYDYWKFSDDDDFGVAFINTATNAAVPLVSTTKAKKEGIEEMNDDCVFSEPF